MSSIIKGYQLSFWDLLGYLLHGDDKLSYIDVTNAAGTEKIELVANEKYGHIIASWHGAFYRSGASINVVRLKMTCIRGAETQVKYIGRLVDGGNSIQVILTSPILTDAGTKVEIEPEGILPGDSLHFHVQHGHIR